MCRWLPSYIAGVWGVAVQYQLPTRLPARAAGKGCVPHAVIFVRSFGANLFVHVQRHAFDFAAVCACILCFQRLAFSVLLAFCFVDEWLLSPALRLFSCAPAVLWRGRRPL